jgi:hypothetical protein
MSQQTRWTSVVATVLLLLLASATHAAKFGYDFDILVDFAGSEAVTTWRDADGNVTRIRVHSLGAGTIYPDTDPTDRETGQGPATSRSTSQGDVQDLRPAVPQQPSR